MATKKKREPLKITCGSTDCGNNLHCFRVSKKMSEEQKGSCRACGARLVDWDRVHQRDFSDVSHTITSLKYEKIRHYFWELPLTQRITDHARRKGRTGMEEAVEKRIRQSVFRPKAENPYDGRQTPLEGDKETLITRGQHAVACCCRTCIEYWHNIPANLPLTDEQMKYFKKLLLMFIDDRLPVLKPDPEKIPRRKKPTSQKELTLEDKGA